MQEPTLDGMPPIKKVRKPRTKKHHTTKNVPVEVSIRRQLSEELGDDEPTKEQKYVLLQKYGVTAPRIDRLVTKPNFMGVEEWKRKKNNWFEITKGMVSASQRPRTFRPSQNLPQQPLTPRQPNLPQKHVQYQKPVKVGHRPWSEIRFKNPESQRRHQQENRSSTNQSRPNSGTTRTETRPS